MNSVDHLTCWLPVVPCVKGVASKYVRSPVPVATACKNRNTSARLVEGSQRHYPTLRSGEIRGLSESRTCTMQQEYQSQLVLVKPRTLKKSGVLDFGNMLDTGKKQVEAGGRR